MYGHLVSVEIRIESRTGQRMQLDGFSFDQFRLECLDTQTVQGRGAVEQNRMPFHYVFQNVPDYRILAIHYLLGGFDGLDNSPFDQFPDNERFV